MVGIAVPHDVIVRAWNVPASSIRPPTAPFACQASLHELLAPASAA